MRIKLKTVTRLFPAFAILGFLPALGQSATTKTTPVRPERTVSLKIGDPAPPLVAAKWIKGTPVTSFSTGKVYVVEFWATWCGPCRASMPHLSALAREYSKEAVVVSFNVHELIAGKDKNGDYISKVERFVKRLGDGMDYTVAADVREGVMWNTWMKAAGLGGIPAAFIVDQRGQIAWIGHPASMDEVLDMVVKGTYSSENKLLLKQQLTGKTEKLKSLKAELQEARLNRAYHKAIQITEMISQLAPLEAGSMVREKYRLLLNMDPAKARQYADASMKELASDPLALQALAMNIVNDTSSTTRPDYALALRIMKQVCLRFDSEDPFATSNLAKAYYMAGDVAMAVNTQQRVIDILNDTTLVEQKQSVKDQAQRDFEIYRGH